jgi:carboxyl-terminal processing protease
MVVQFDPHTFYLAPSDKDRFDASMSGKFEGIGARLTKKKSADKNCRSYIWRSSVEK